MQNAVVNIPNGAVCCKLWHKIISGLVPQSRRKCVCRQDICCVCKQDICCVNRRDICCGIVSADVSQDSHPTYSTQGRPRRQQMSCLQTRPMSCLQTHFLQLLEARSAKRFTAVACNILWLRLEYRPLDSACFFGTQL